MSGVLLSGVSVNYNGRTALDEVGLEVAAGEWVALVGPNGAGKTTLLRAVAGTVPYRGRITIGGTERSELRRREAARLVAAVPQAPVLPSGMTAVEYVLLGRTPHLGYWEMEKAGDLTLAREVLGRLGAADLALRPLGSLSGGERQRVVLSRALAQQAPVLILDEPTTALDIGHQQQVLDLVDELRRERDIAVLSALHDLTLAAQYGDRVALLAAGRLEAEGPAAAVFTPERLEGFSDARVVVLRGPGGELVVAPRRAGAQEVEMRNSDPMP